MKFKSVKSVDFLYLGPDKSGSTWLFEMLRMQDGIHIAKCKDLYFFDRYFNRGINWYKKKINYGLDKEGLIKGEISHDYLFSQVASMRIKSYLPEVKMLTFFRDPIARSFSQYLYIKKSGLTKKSFLDAINDYPEIIENSLYHLHLDKYAWAIERGNLKILLFEDLVKSEEKFARDIIAFINPSPSKEVKLPGKQREASEARFYFLSKLFKLAAVKARDLGFEDLIGKIKHSRYMSLIYKEYKVKPRPTKEEVDFMMSCFAGSLSKLKVNYGVNVDRWLAKYE